MAKPEGKVFPVKNLRSGVTERLTQAELQQRFKELQKSDSSVRMTVVNGRKAIVNSAQTLYEF